MQYQEKFCFVNSNKINKAFQNIGESATMHKTLKKIAHYDKKY